MCKKKVNLHIMLYSHDHYHQLFNSKPALLVDGVIMVVMGKTSGSHVGGWLFKDLAHSFEGFKWSIWYQAFIPQPFYLDYLRIVTGIGNGRMFFMHFLRIEL